MLSFSLRILFLVGLLVMHLVDLEKVVFFWANSSLCLSLPLGFYAIAFPGFWEDLTDEKFVEMDVPVLEADRESLNKLGKFLILFIEVRIRFFF